MADLNTYGIKSVETAVALFAEIHARLGTTPVLTQDARADVAATLACGILARTPTTQSLVDNGRPPHGE